MGKHLRTKKGFVHPDDSFPIGVPVITLALLSVSGSRSWLLPGGVLPEKLGGGVRPTSQNPYPIYDQNLRFFLPYLWPGQKFNTLFMTVAAGAVAVNLSYEGLLLMVLLKTKKK